MTKNNFGMFYGVGLGPGDPELVTLKALKVLQQVDCIFAVESRQSERSVSVDIVLALPRVTAKLEKLVFTMSKDWQERLAQIDKNAEQIANELKNSKNCAFVTIGDPMTYSTCSYLLRALKKQLPELKSQIIPGVNSWSELAAKTQTPLVEDCEVLRIVPSYESKDDDLDFPENSTTILLKTYRSRNDLLKRIPADTSVAYGANLGLKEEKLATDKDQIKQLPEPYLSMLMVKKGKKND